MSFCAGLMASIIATGTPAISYMARHHQQSDRLVPFLTKPLPSWFVVNIVTGVFRDMLSPTSDRAGRRSVKIGFANSSHTHEREDTVNTLNGDFYLMPATPRNYVLRRLDSNLAGTGAVYERRMMTSNMYCLAILRLVVSGRAGIPPPRSTRNGYTGLEISSC